MEEIFILACTGVVQGIGELFKTFRQIILLLMGSVYTTDIAPTSAITAVGVSLTTLFFTMEMFSQMAQFRVERIEDAIRIAMRFVVAKVIIENTSGISKGIFGIFMKGTGDGITNALDSVTANLASLVIEPDKGGFLGAGYTILFVFLCVVYVVFFFQLLKIVISYIGIAFEIGIHQSLAPIALSTLCNDTVRQTGITFMKSYAATCLQLAVITAIFEVFGELTGKFAIIKFVDTSTSTAADLGIFASLVELLMPLLLIMALCKAIKTSTDLTKRMFGV